MTAATLLDGVRACVFDAYGTLFDVVSAAARCSAALGGRHQELGALWRAKQLEYTWLRSLRGDYIDFWHVTGEALDFALDSFGMADPALRARLMELYFVLDAYPDVRETLPVLRSAGLRCAILSNGAPSMLTAAVQRAGLDEFLAEVISADPIGIYKPHPSVYQLAVDRLRVPAEAICFVSSNYWDVSGAALFGFRVVWINRGGGRRDPLPGAPEAEITALRRLPALLGIAPGITGED